MLQVLILTTFISTTYGQDTKDSLSIDAILSLKRVSDIHQGTAQPSRLLRVIMTTQLPNGIPMENRWSL